MRAQPDVAPESHAAQRDEERKLPRMAQVRCLNCDAGLSDGIIFCSHCAQRTDTGRLSFADVARDALQTFVNVERGPIAFGWALLTRPGITAREYVEGKRRRHYGPFATLIVLVGFAALAVNLSGFQVLSHDGLTGRPTDLLQRHFNLLLLVQVPLLAMACRLVFHRANLRLPEHMVLGAYAIGVRAILLAMVAPITLATSKAPTAGLVYAFWGAWYLYFGWAASQFYRGPRIGSWARGVLAAALGHAGIVALLFAGNRVYEAVMA